MKTITVKVQPKAKQERVERLDDATYRVKVSSAPDKGKANKRLIELLAKEFDVAKSKIEIIKGTTSREKVVRIGMMFLCLTACLFAGIAPVQAADEPITVSAAVDKDTITIGDRINYTLTITHNEGVAVTYPELAVQLGMFEIKDYMVEGPTKDKEGLITVTQHYEITTFTTGEYTIPVLAISYEAQGGETKTVQTDEITITVESVAKDAPMTDIRPIKAPAAIPVSWRRLIWIIAGIIGALAIGGGIFIWHKRRQQEVAMPPLPPRPPEELAREALSVLEASSLIDEGKIKEYYDRLSDIIRAYIEGRYRIFALDRTTAELYSEMRTKKIERSHADTIKRFLDAADMVKFAKYAPVPDDITAETKQAWDIVEATTPVVSFDENVVSNE